MTKFPDSLQDDLIKHLYWWACQHGEISRFRWVMNQEWWNTCRALTDPQGRPLWLPAFNANGQHVLLGAPINIRDDGGVPHLELCPASS